jgi:hypothetical protein
MLGQGIPMTSNGMVHTWPAEECRAEGGRGVTGRKNVAAACPGYQGPALLVGPHAHVVEDAVAVAVHQPVDVLILLAEPFRPPARDCRTMGGTRQSDQLQVRPSVGLCRPRS